MQPRRQITMRDVGVYIAGESGSPEEHPQIKSYGQSERETTCNLRSRHIPAADLQKPAIAGEQAEGTAVICSQLPAQLSPIARRTLERDAGYRRCRVPEGNLT